MDVDDANAKSGLKGRSGSESGKGYKCTTTSSEEEARGTLHSITHRRAFCEPMLALDPALWTDAWLCWLLLLLCLLSVGEPEPALEPTLEGTPERSVFPSVGVANGLSVPSEDEE